MLKMRRSIKLIFGIVAWFLAPMMAGISWAGEPPKDPILRIETGMHTAWIMRIGVDAENRYLVTASTDKTLRVWELLTGRLLRVIRPPIGKGSEGKLNAVALSPDGNTIACGGNTGLDWEKQCSIYLFDRATGSLKKRISGLPNVVFHLAFSPDSKNLVACLFGKNGIRIYRTDTWQEVAQDGDYGDDSQGAAFDQQGRLVTSSYDGYIRLYDRSFRLLAKRKAPGGERPFSVAFSPDGKMIAVGFFDSTKVNIISGEDLSFLYAPDTSGVDNGNLYSISFSSNGRSLFAGGRWEQKNTTYIRKWSGEGWSNFKDIPTGADNSIYHIIPLYDGSIVYGSLEPAFGVITDEDKASMVIAPSIANYRDSNKGFLLSYDGMTVGFGYERFGKSSAVFSVPSRLLDSEPKIQNPELKAPVMEFSGLTITNWKNTFSPKLNEKDLKLRPYEICWSLAIAPEGKAFLLGTEWLLRLYDQEGNQQWEVPIPGVARSVNISGNGRIAVAAFGDGTIRWYRMTDGKELLAFFPHKDKKRWILWTPKGYYDCSPNAENLIGWHVNNGKDQAADFFPVSKFRSIYYRPDVVAKVLETLNEEEALDLANHEAGRKKLEVPIQKMLPPVVTILYPQDGASLSSTDITLRFSLRTPSGEPVTRTKVLIDGRPIIQRRPAQAIIQDKDIQEIKVTIPERDCQVSILAENKYSTSEPATVQLVYNRGGKNIFVIKPRLYVLAIGVSKYQDQGIRLGLPAKDARDFVQAMEKQKGGLYREVVVKLLTDEKATRDEVLDGLDWIQKETTSNDVAMVFLAGHGVNDSGGTYYFLPVNTNIDKLKSTGVVFFDIKNTFESIAGKALLFLDTCHAGNIMGKRRGDSDINALVNELSSAEKGAVVFASSTGRQYSMEDQAWGNGAFTKALVEGINGRADYQKTGRITVNMLDLYISERVKELTNGRQTPTTAKPQTIPDFPVAIKR